MPRDGAGNYGLPSGNPVVTNTIISSGGWANPTLSDIATALTQSLSRDGQTTPTADLTMGNFKLRNLANALARTDAVPAAQIQDSTLTILASISGTDTITASTAPAITAYTAGQQFSFNTAGANTTNAVTLNINALGAKALMKQGVSGPVQLSPGDLQNVQTAIVRYDGTQFILVSPPAPTVSAGLVNKVINGGFDVWQRGTSFTNAATAAAAYGPDCWQIYRTSFATGYTASLNSSTVPAGSRFALRVQRTAGDVNTQNINVSTSFESGDVIRWVGKTATLAWSVFGNGAFNGATLTALAFFGTGVDGNAAAGFTGSFGNVSTTQTLSGTYARGTFTFAVPANATQFAISFSVSPTGAAGAADYFQLAQVQINEGASAYPFETRGYATEFALCTRYYQILNTLSFFGYSNAANPIGYSATVSPMRAAPTVTLLGTPGYTNASALSVGGISATSVNFAATVTATGSASWNTGGNVALNASM
jgi:hypothetical protein